MIRKKKGYGGAGYLQHRPRPFGKKEEEKTPRVSFSTFGFDTQRREFRGQKKRGSLNISHRRAKTSCFALETA